MYIAAVLNNSQDLEAIQMSISRWLSEKAGEGKILCKHRSKQNADLYNVLD